MTCIGSIDKNMVLVYCYSVYPCCYDSDCQCRSFLRDFGFRTVWRSLKVFLSYMQTSFLLHDFGILSLCNSSDDCLKQYVKISLFFGNEECEIVTMKKSNSPDMLRKYYCNREFPFLTSFENYLKSAIDENILFCIGNGFDLAHGAKVSYSKFKSYLKKYQSDLFAALNRRIGFNDVALWSDFENQLVYLRDTYKNSNLCSKKELDDFNHDIDLITSMLKQSFRDWMNCPDDDFKIYISSNNLKYINLIRSNSYYLTFNYTEFLEDSSLYRVNHDNVFHIHGCRLDHASKLMTGFNISTNYALNLNASPDIVNGGVIIGGYSANTNATSPIANYLHDFSKYSYFLEHRQQFSSFLIK